MKPGRGGHLPPLLPDRHHVGVPAHRDPLVVLGRAAGPRRGEGRAQPRAEVTGQQVAVDVELPLAPPVARGQGDQHRSAPVGRRLGPALRDEVLHPQPRARAAELGGDRSRCGAAARRERRRVRALHLVREQDVLFGGGQAGHRGADEGRLLLAEQLVLGPWLRLVRLREQMGVAAGALLALHERGDQVAGRGDRVRHERLVLDARPRRHDPGQGLLHDVVARRGIGDPGRDHPADDRDEVDDRLLRRGDGLRHVHAHLSHGFGGLVTPSGLVQTRTLARRRTVRRARDVPYPIRSGAIAPLR